MLQAKLLAIAGLLILALGGFSWVQFQQLRAERRHSQSLTAQLAGVERSRKAAVKASADRAKEAAIAKAEARAAREELDQALAGPAREWADTPVPQEVLNALD